MSRVVALIDGEHYPPVVRFALEELGREHEVVAAAFVGGTEKVGADAAREAYGVPVVRALWAAAALSEAIARFRPDAVVDLSDEPVLSSASRFALASIALEHGVAYLGADFAFTPAERACATRTPALAITGTGKRVGKTAVSAYAARRLSAAGIDLAVLAMGRGGPAEPELLRGGEVALTTDDLLGFAAQGRHASSDNYEDAVMARVTTIGCRRCGGGMAGATFFSNVPEGAALADTLGAQLLVLEGSGAAVPPVRSDASLLVVGAGQGAGAVRDYFGPLRVRQADAIVVAGAEEPFVSTETVDEIIACAHLGHAGIPVTAVVFRPRPLEPIEGARVFYATTAPSAMLSTLKHHLEGTYGCEVVAASPNLSDRGRLHADLVAAAGTFDTILTELKAAAIDVVAMTGAEIGVPTVLCDNVPERVAGDDLDAAIDAVAALAMRRGAERGELDADR